MDRPLTVTALLGRTSDRTPEGALGAAALAPALAARGRGRLRLAGATPPPVPDGHWRDDLRDAEPVLREADPHGILLASDCTICIASLPRLDEDVAVVWLDAHADFNSPATTASQFLGGMCAAGACGVWDTGWGSIDPARLVFAGLRDVEDGERALIDASGATVLGHPREAAEAVAGRRVFVHLDLDVLDPPELPGALFPVPGGLSFAELGAALEALAGTARDVVGAEVTSFTDPAQAERFAGLLEPLLA